MTSLLSAASKFATLNREAAEVKDFEEPKKECTTSTLANYWKMYVNLCAFVVTVFILYHVYTFFYPESKLFKSANPEKDLETSSSGS
jgi:hypothetical protein